MATAPPTTNVAAQIVGGFIQALMSGGEAAAEAYLTAQVPVLANPILQDILDWLVSDIGGALQTVLINNATGIVINIQTSSEQAGIVAAATALQIAQASGDPSAIATALNNAKSAYQSLLNWNGTYSSP